MMRNNLEKEEAVQMKQEFNAHFGEVYKMMNDVKEEQNYESGDEGANEENKGDKPATKKKTGFF